MYDSGFAQGPAGIDSTATGSEAGSYTVRGGDTLAGIAAQLWGDAGLWYKLAEANGLGAGTALAAGQSLRLPAGVLRSAYSDATLSPYDHAGAIGDIQPTTPQPPAPRTSHSKKHCGGFGTVLLAVVAVAVTVATAGAAVAALSPTIGGIGSGIGAFLGIGGATTGLGAATLVGVGAVAGAAGSIASQAVGVATGIQDKFSWKGVALAGISGGVGGGLGAALPGGGVGLAAARGALGNAATQGIALATGLQSKFDFAGVAAAGVGGGAGAWVGGRLGTSFGASLAAGTASALAGAATRSAIEGSGFGDNIRRAIPDAIGSAIGNALARSLARPPGARSAPALAKAGGDPVAEANDTVGAEAEAAARGGGGWVNSEAIARAVDDALLRDGPLAAGFEPVLERDLAVLAMGNAVYAAGESRGRAQYEAISREYAALSASDKLNFQAANHILPPPPARAGTDPDHLVTIVVRPTASFAELAVWENDLRAKEAAHGGAYPESEGVWSGYAANREDLIQNYAYADRQAFELVNSGLSIFNTPTAIYRMAVNGEVNWGNGITVAAGLFGAGAIGREIAAGARLASAGRAVEGGVLSPFTQRYLTESGGRFGSRATRAQNYRLAQKLDNEGYPITGGGGFLSEEYIKGIGPGSRGGTFVDITGRAADGRIVRIQTIDTLSDGLTPTSREAAAAARVRAAFPNDELRLIPKGR